MTLAGASQARLEAESEAEARAGTWERKSPGSESRNELKVTVCEVALGFLTVRTGAFTCKDFGGVGKPAGAGSRVLPTDRGVWATCSQSLDKLTHSSVYMSFWTELNSCRWPREEMVKLFKL